MNTKPKLSIIIPVYKVEEYIRECLDSIKNQTFTDYEVLLIDDGSPDGSDAICDEYAAKDSRFKVWHKENGGVSSARNLGLDNAQGEWIHFIDPDDYILSDKVYEEILEQAKDDYDIIRFGFTREGKEFHPSYFGISENKLNRDGVINNSFRFYNVWTCIIKRIKINNHRFVNLKTGQDLLFIQSLLFREEIQAILIINKAYIYYRKNPNSTTENFQPTRMNDLLETIKSHKKEIESKNIPIKEIEFNKFLFHGFFRDLTEWSKLKNDDFLVDAIKEYYCKLEISKILTWQYVFDRSKPILPYLYLKLKLYKLFINELKKRK